MCVTVFTVQVTYKKQDGFLMKVNGAEKQLNISGTLSVTDDRLNITCHIDNSIVKSHVVISPTDIHLFTKVRDKCTVRAVFWL
jgi:hypothetical protein